MSQEGDVTPAAIGKEAGESVLFPLEKALKRTDERKRGCPRSLDGSADIVPPVDRRERKLWQARTARRALPSIANAKHALYTGRDCSPQQSAVNRANG
jgi:hypothetical protein